eukprot:550432_1
MKESLIRLAFAVLYTFPPQRCAQTFKKETVSLDQGVRYHFVSSYNNTLWIAAGSGEPYEDRTGTEWTPLPLNNDSWWYTENATFPMGISAMANDGDCAVLVGSKIYIINPWTGTGTNYHQTFIYDLSSGSYFIASQPTYYTIGVCTAYNSAHNIIYTVGGYRSRDEKYTQIYDVGNNTWMTPGNDMNHGRKLAGCWSANDWLYVFGGSNENSIERYNISLDEWTEITAILSERKQNLKCREMITSYIWCIGGQIGSNTASSTVDIFDPLTENIVNVIHLNIARYLFDAVTWGQCLMVIGGYDGTNVLDSVETGDCAETISPTTATLNLTTNPTTSIPTTTVPTTTDPTTSTPTLFPSTIQPTLTTIINQLTTFNPTIFPSTTQPTTNQLTSTIPTTTTPTKNPTTSNPTTTTMQPTSIPFTVYPTTIQPTLFESTDNEDDDCDFDESLDRNDCDETDLEPNDQCSILVEAEFDVCYV